MTFNKVETQTQAANFNFLKNQSTVLHTTESNDVNINGVNVITATPTKGDVLCITRKMLRGSLLGPDKQDIVWVKGMTINFEEFPNDIYEPVGIVYKVRGRVAYVRYRTEVNRRYSYCDRFDITGSAMTDGNPHTVDIVAKDGDTEILRITTKRFVSTSVSAFTEFLASELAKAPGNTRVSAEYVGPNDADGTDYLSSDGRCVVSIKFPDNRLQSFYIYAPYTTEEVLTATRSIARDIQGTTINNVRNNGGVMSWGGCNFNKFLDYYSVNGDIPNRYIGTIIDGNLPVNRNAFETFEQCKFLRDYYVTYENYIRDNMLTWPIGPRSDSAIGLYADKGAEHTNLLAKATYKDPANGLVNTPLYGAAHYCATVGANHTLLVPGKWWLPSAGDMMDLMEDVTYGTNAWPENPDIVNQVLMKLNENTNDETKGFRFSMLSASKDQWTSTGCPKINNIVAYLYNASDGTINVGQPYWDIAASPITQIEF